LVAPFLISTLKKEMKMYFYLFLSIVLSFGCQKSVTDEMDDSSKKSNVIQIDVSKQTKAIKENPGGVVACWLMDSDIERPRKTSFSNAMKDMGVKFIRFPYGHLADNYLWDADGDWGNTLTPKVASFSQAPGQWEWAVDQSTGEFKKDMDFNEYISICNDVGAEPMVVVNILSYKYENGPTYEKLKETAVEWVRYANITKSYNVKRWAIGNEVDHHSDLISLEEYKALYTDFATAMKEVDPDIMIGPGLLGNWHSEMLNHAPELIDFICVHNYLYKYEWRNQNYEGWKNTTDILVNNVEKCQHAVNNSSIPDIEIHVTEMNSRPWKDNSDNDDIFRALAYGEMVLNACGFENVTATYVWNTHGPWGGPEENAPYNILDLDNNREPRGEITKIINENIQDYFVEVPRVSGFIRSYAMVNKTNEKLTVFLINKNDESEKVEINISGLTPDPEVEIIEYSGKHPNDENPVYSNSVKVDVHQNHLLTELKPLSFKVLKIKKQD
jgi:alpha-L-arabinofuranosidase